MLLSFFFFSSHISNILRKNKNKNKNKAQHPLALGTIPVFPIFYRKKKNICKATATLHAILIKHHNPLGHIDLSYGTLMNHS